MKEAEAYERVYRGEKLLLGSVLDGEGRTPEARGCP